VTDGSDGSEPVEAIAAIAPPAPSAASPPASAEPNRSQLSLLGTGGTTGITPGPALMQQPDVEMAATSGELERETGHDKRPLSPDAIAGAAKRQRTERQPLHGQPQWLRTGWRVCTRHGGRTGVVIGPLAPEQGEEGAWYAIQLDPLLDQSPLMGQPPSKVRLSSDDLTLALPRLLLLRELPGWAVSVEQLLPGAQELTPRFAWHAPGRSFETKSLAVARRYHEQAPSAPASCALRERYVAERELRFEAEPEHALEAALKAAQWVELDLRSIRLGELPTAIGEQTSLQILRADYNELRKLPDTLGDLAQLRVLSLTRNHLDELPDSLGRLSRLVELILDENASLRILPVGLAELAELVLFSAIGCALSGVPRALVLKLHKLKSLSVEGNQVGHLTFDSADVASIESLDVSHNSLTCLPELIGSQRSAYRQVSRLSLCSNSLCLLPRSFADLPLVELDLSYNRFAGELPPAIHSLKQLEELDLTGNQLVRLTAELGELRKLRLLWLSDNRLAHVDVGALLKLQQLEHLGIANELSGDEGNGALDAELIDASRGSGEQLREKLHLWLQNRDGESAAGLGARIDGQSAWLRGSDDTSELEEIVRSEVKQLPEGISKQLRKLELSRLGSGCDSIPDSWVCLRLLRTLLLSGEPTDDREARKHGPLDKGLPRWMGELKELLYGACVVRVCSARPLVASSHLARARTFPRLRVPASHRPMQSLSTTRRSRACPQSCAVSLSSSSTSLTICSSRCPQSCVASLLWLSLTSRTTCSRPLTCSEARTWQLPQTMQSRRQARTSLTGSPTLGCST
jgi:Leucine-rich repeat (LRR) protein